VADHDGVIREIDRLESMVPSGLLAGDKWDCKALWNQIRATGAAFKGVRFPSRDEHQQAWERFQSLVQEVKDKQAASRERFEQRRAESERLRERLVRRAEQALPDDSGLGDLILAVATGGLSLAVKVALDTLLGLFDERKEELLRASRALKEVWNEFSAEKRSLLRDDKDTVYHALKSAQARLDDLWDRYKDERQKALDAYHREKRQRHEEWRERTLGNVRNNQERKSRLEGVLNHKRGHLESLAERLADARSDEYRSRVLGWIEEERDAILDIQGKIDQINSWIAEDLEKLRQ